jgi:hypothetical protein
MADGPVGCGPITVVTGGGGGGGDDVVGGEG